MVLFVLHYLGAFALLGMYLDKAYGVMVLCVVCALLFDFFVWFDTRH